MAPVVAEEKNTIPPLNPQFLYGVKKGVNGGLNFLGEKFFWSFCLDL